jgi:antitoxin (DNA-binding transcriptional repressor) of toxin-antitoxin stability system
MKTLTITEAKKNLGAWLKAAGRGEEVAILSGADVIALRKVEIEAVDCGYASTEYGATPQELERFERAVDQRFAASKKAGRVMTLEQIEKALEKAPANRRHRI